MKNLGCEIDLPIEVYGPEINMTAIVGMALGEDLSEPDTEVTLPPQIKVASVEASGDAPSRVLFTTKTRAIIFGRQFVAAQVRLCISIGSSFWQIMSYWYFSAIKEPEWTYSDFIFQLMLDYDKACGRDTPSVACIVDPFTGTSRQAAFWGTTPHYLPSKFETFPNEAFLDKFL